MNSLLTCICSPCVPVSIPSAAPLSGCLESAVTAWTAWTPHSPRSALQLPLLLWEVSLCTVHRFRLAASRVVPVARSMLSVPSFLSPSARLVSPAKPLLTFVGVSAFGAVILPVFFSARCVSVAVQACHVII